MIEMLSREFSKKVFDDLPVEIVNKLKLVDTEEGVESGDKESPLDIASNAIMTISYMVDNGRTKDGNWQEFVADTKLTDEEMLVIEALMIKHGWTSGMARI